MSRLTIDITDQQHQALKAMAVLEGKTINQFTVERLFAADDEQQAMHQLKALLSVRVAEARQGELEQASITEVMEREQRQAGAA